ncbi:hypothetical protein [Rhodopirellula baltica]
MTTVIQFENNNWYAEGVAVMDNELYNHPTMQWALEAIAKESGFDFVSAFERDTDYQRIHQLADESDG